MRTVNNDEMFSNLCDFLKSKGVELTDGSYAGRIRQACDLLADTVNATHRTVTRAKVKVDRTLDQLRETIHNATAPKPAETPEPPPASEPGSSRPAASSATRPRRAKTRPVRPRRQRARRSNRRK